MEEREKRINKDVGRYDWGCIGPSLEEDADPFALGCNLCIAAINGAS